MTLTSDSPASVVASRALSLALGQGGDPVPEGALSVLTPDGLIDGQTAVLTTDGSEGWDFGAGPTKRAAVGFGQGPMYAQALGSLVEAHTDPLTSEALLFESGGEIVEQSGIRWLRRSGSGLGINWDTGAEIGENTSVYMTSLVKATVGVVDQGGTTQWKTYRVYPNKQLDDNPDGSAGYPNTWYHKSFSADRNETDKGQWNLYKDSMSAVHYNGAHPTLDGRITRHTVWANTGNVGQSNGSFVSQDIRPDTSLGIIERGFTKDSVNSATDGVEMYTSTNSNRWRWLFLQDYVNYTNGTEVIDRADIYWQIGSLARFELADAATPEEVQASYVLPVKAYSSSEVTVHLWKSLFSSYSGKFIHFYDDDGVFRKAVAL